jgi:hypothetical protein
MSDVLAYLVGRLAKEPDAENADVLAELLAVEVTTAQQPLQPVPA